jgi:hypothetical protein
MFFSLFFPVSLFVPLSQSRELSIFRIMINFVHSAIVLFHYTQFSDVLFQVISTKFFSVYFSIVFYSV